MALAERVHVARRFQRAVRIDLDLGEPGRLGWLHLPAVVSGDTEDDGAARR